MTMFPIFYAVIENDLRRVLGYSMINQIGFMVAGIGLGEGMEFAKAFILFVQNIPFEPKQWDWDL
ncbi:MAG: hypothetical protein CL675_12580 [Bdellovibrionaceae bacterium]|nr:hypothetical protein [Pseudobdellovibrionaceae bacterium]